MAMARRWERFGGQPTEVQRPSVSPLDHLPAARRLAGARTAWAAASDVLGGVSGLLTVLAITALFSPLLVYGMLAPVVHLWQPAASSGSLLALLPIVWLFTSAWVLRSALRR